MRKLIFSSLVFGTLVLATALATFAVAHEGHQMECTETNINAMSADVQAMGDGEDKTEAMKEIQLAQHMMSKKDMQGCMTHMNNAMEATEK
jgi:hypothetical protein